MFFYRIYQIFVMVPVLAVATIITSVVTVIGTALGGGRWWGYYPEVVWGRLFCWLSWVRVTVKGRENIDPNTSYVFVSNHQGAYDIFSIFGYLGHNFRWMMKQSLGKIPFVGWACRRSHQIFVDNSSPAATRRTMENAQKVLRGGMSLMIFPEGARTMNGKMRPFKRGAFRLALEFNLPVVPVTIDGAFDVMPRFKRIPRPGHIRITIHKPIPPTENGHDLTQVMSESFAAISEPLPARNK